MLFLNHKNLLYGLTAEQSSFLLYCLFVLLLSQISRHQDITFTFQAESQRKGQKVCYLVLLNLSGAATVSAYIPLIRLNPRETQLQGRLGNIVFILGSHMPGSKVYNEEWKNGYGQQLGVIYLRTKPCISEISIAKQSALSETARLRQFQFKAEPLQTATFGIATSVTSDCINFLCFVLEGQGSEAREGAEIQVLELRFRGDEGERKVEATIKRRLATR